MKQYTSTLFDRAGYITIREYMDDINRMKRCGPWKLPLGIGDRCHIFFLSCFVRFSWFSDRLFILWPEKWSPAYAILVTYLRKQGIFTSIDERSMNYGGWRNYYFHQKFRLYSRWQHVAGQGTYRTASVAFSKGLGEIIERMVTGILDQNTDITLASPRQLSRQRRYEFLYPPKYHRFLSIQLDRYRELHRDSMCQIEWVKGTNLITSRQTLIPRQMTRWFIGGGLIRERLQYPSSNGSAGFFTEEGAILRGILEVVHRDALLVHWLTTIAPRRIRKDTLPDVLQKEIDSFESRGISLFVLDITALPFPSVCIVGINEHSIESRIVMSAAANMKFEEAIRDALAEMVMMAQSLVVPNDAIEKTSLDIEPFVSHVSRRDRQMYWQGTEARKQFQWFVEGEQISFEIACQQDIVSKESDAEKLVICFELLKNLGPGYYPILYRPSHPVQQAVGFFVVQVFIPKAFPLYLNEWSGTFDSDRLVEFARKKGRCDWTLNPLPHMFV